MPIASSTIASMNVQHDGRVYVQEKQIDQNGVDHGSIYLAAAGTTAVFYMGLARLDHIVARLLEHGAATALPAALIGQGTLPQQRVIAATLGTIADVAGRSAVASPALLVVGSVVGLQSKLEWFRPTPEVDLSRSA